MMPFIFLFAIFAIFVENSDAKYIGTDIKKTISTVENIREALKNLLVKVDDVHRNLGGLLSDPLNTDEGNKKLKNEKLTQISNFDVFSRKESL